MAVVKGQGGKIQIDTVDAGHLTNWTITSTVDPVETTEMTDTAKSYTGGLEDGTISCTCWWDASDAGQEDILDGLAAGSTITVNIFPSGSTSSGADYYTGDILILSSGVKGDMGAGLVTAEFSGNCVGGPMTLGTVV